MTPTIPCDALLGENVLDNYFSRAVRGVAYNLSEGSRCELTYHSLQIYWWMVFLSTHGEASESQVMLERPKKYQKYKKKRNPHLSKMR